MNTHFFRVRVAYCVLTSAIVLISLIVTQETWPSDVLSRPTLWFETVGWMERVPALGSSGCRLL